MRLTIFILFLLFQPLKQAMGQFIEFDNQDYTNCQRKTKGVKKIVAKPCYHYRNFFRRCISFCLSWTSNPKFRCHLGSRSVYYYDENGFLTCRINYDNWTTLRSTTNYKYNISDSLIEIRTSISVFDDPKSVDINRIYFDGEGRCKCSESYDENYELISKTDYYYDENSKLKIVKYPYSTLNFEYSAYSCICRYGYKLSRSNSYSVYKFKNGNLTDYIYFCDNGENVCVIANAICVSRDKTDNYHIKYSNFTKSGIWKKSYWVTYDRGNILNVKRKIKYYKN
mgnify:CR=1 FL=1